MALDRHQAFDLISASALFAYHTDQLSDFEVETIAELGQRFRDHGMETVITEAESLVLHDAVEALRRAAAKTGRKVAA